MTTHPIKYFEHYLDAGRSIAVHRVDELVQITFSHGRDDEHPDVVFFAPMSAHAFVEGVDAAARDAQSVFEAASSPGPAAPAEPPAVGGLPPWGPVFAFGGLPYTMCPAGDGRVGPGQAAKAEAATGRIWHDDCAEVAGAYRQSLTCPDPLTPASAPLEASVASAAGGAHGAAGADRAYAGPCRPAAPTTSRRS